jgi:hypothetical protein
VIEEGDRLDLGVELVARGGCCPRCGRVSLDVKDRPVVRVRDLPLAGARDPSGVAQAALRLRRMRADVHGVSSRASAAPARDASLPPASLRAGAWRRRARRGRPRRADGALSGRACLSGAEDELAAGREARRVRRLSLDEAHHRRGRDLAAVVSDLDRRGVVEVLDGRARQRV